LNKIADARWYVVQTRPHGERKAAAHLKRQGFDVYLPRYLKRRRHARRVDTVAAPLFPRYLFVAIDMMTQRWRAVRSTVGVNDIVSFGEDPVAVQDEVIDELRQREDGAGLVQLDRHAAFARGDKVRVLEGAFTEYLAVFDAMTDHERVSVLIDLLGRKVRVAMDSIAIEAA
jgi:transcriptional antiterminator RfaH